MKIKTITQNNDIIKLNNIGKLPVKVREHHSVNFIKRVIYCNELGGVE